MFHVMVVIAYWVGSESKVDTQGLWSGVGNLLIPSDPPKTNMSPENLNGWRTYFLLK